MEILITNIFGLLFFFYYFLVNCNCSAYEKLCFNPIFPMFIWKQVWLNSLELILKRRIGDEMDIGLWFCACPLHPLSWGHGLLAFWSIPLIYVVFLIFGCIHTGPRTATRWALHLREWPVAGPRWPSLLQKEVAPDHLHAIPSACRQSGPPLAAIAVEVVLWRATACAGQCRGRACGRTPGCAPKAAGFWPLWACPNLATAFEFQTWPSSLLDLHWC